MKSGLRTAALLLMCGAILVTGCSKKSPTQPQSLVAPGVAAADHGGASDGSETPVVTMASGAIEPTVAAFRTQLGDPNNLSAVGEQPNGRREVNWDGVPKEFTNTDAFPNDFFNTTVTRGLFYNRTGHGLEVSGDGFTDVNPDYVGVFNTFSPLKLFSPIGGTDVDVRFQVAGASTKAAVTGIGVVFADVDRLGSTTIHLLGEHGDDLGTFTAPVRSDERGLSFLGITFSTPKISRVRIVSGDGRISREEKDVTQGGRHDLVVMDNFLYGEPHAIAN